MNRRALVMGAVLANGAASYNLSDEEHRNALLARMRQLHTSSLMRSMQSPYFVQIPAARSQLAECSGHEDNKHINGAMEKIEKGVTKLMKKYPGRHKPEVKTGMRGPRFFIEVPLVGKNIDAFSLVVSTENIL